MAQNNPSELGSMSDQHQDEINLLEYLYVLLKHKKLIITFFLTGIVLGLVFAVAKGPTWEASAVIAPRETETQSSSLAGLGAFNGLVSGYLGMGGNASLEKIDVILASRSFFSELISKYNLAPLVLETVVSKKYSDKWDSNNSEWKDTTDTISTYALGGILADGVITHNIQKNNTMEIYVSSPDSSTAFTLLQHSIAYLDKYIRDQVETESKQNVNYLNDRMVGVSDPLLREKLLGIIAGELEKAMAVSNKAFRVIDPTFLEKKTGNKILYALAAGLGLSIFAVFVVISIYVFFGTSKSENDRVLIDGIVKELHLSRFAALLQTKNKGTD